jgi:dienelactone hydrolase
MKTEILDYTDVALKLEGFVAFDETRPGRRPAVIISHAWAGQGEFEREKAKKLAQLGYVGFALDMYGKGKRGSSPEENAKLMQPFIDDRALLSRRINAAIQTIARHPMVDASHIGAIGFCFGGLCALDLARAVPHGLRGVVAFHGLLGAPQLPRKKITARVLALHGWDDPLAPPDQVLAFAKEMTEAGADWQLHAYGHTVHAFTNPEAKSKEMGFAYDATADRRSWIEMKAFFEEVFE